MSKNDAKVDHEIVLLEPESVLKSQFGENVEVIKFESAPFTKTGDNYGSTMLKVRILIKTSDSASVKELKLLAKMLPPTEEKRVFFECSYTFRKEIFFYQELIPTYQSIYNEDLDVAPKFYGARLSLKSNSGEMDNDAVILMENLKLKGYYMVDRHKGLDLAHAKVAVKTLAKYHAVGIAVKQKKPEFLAKLKKYSMPLALKGDEFVKFLQVTLDNLKSDFEMSKVFDRITAQVDIYDLQKNNHKTLDLSHPWACVVHKDIWNNNIVFHQDDEGNVDDAKLVDFQTYCVSSPLTDLIFFLCTSLAMPLTHLDEMLEYYREIAIDVLEKIECDSSLFGEEEFEKRLSIDAANELFHILRMSKVVELRDGEDMVESPPNDYCIRRLRKIVRIFVEKNWI